MGLNGCFFQSNHSKHSAEKPQEKQGIPLLSLGLCIIFKIILSEAAQISGSILAH
jgi:hypothetical protein